MKSKLIRRIVEYIKEPLLAILAALLISTFIMSHTRVPTESMLNTIEAGDHLIVSPVPYYYRDPDRGEIVVFNLGDENLIKRIIGMPGDIINIVDNNVYINGEKSNESDYLAHLDSTYLYAGSDISFPYRVPEGYYFVMGDNRKNSKDSRVFGPISRENIIAKAGLTIFPFDRIGFIE